MRPQAGDGKLKHVLPSHMEIASLTIDEIREGLLARSFRAEELAAEALRFAEEENPKTGAYLHFSPERALATARRVDERIARGEECGGELPGARRFCFLSSFLCRLLSPGRPSLHCQCPSIWL